MQISNKEKLSVGINIPSYRLIKGLFWKKAWKPHPAHRLSTQLLRVDPLVKDPQLTCLELLRREQGPGGSGWSPRLTRTMAELKPPLSVPQFPL